MGIEFVLLRFGSGRFRIPGFHCFSAHVSHRPRDSREPEKATLETTLHSERGPKSQEYVVTAFEAYRSAENRIFPLKKAPSGPPWVWVTVDD